MDFLGLRNLTVIDDAERQIRALEPGFSMKRIRDDDPATFAMLGEGKTAGVFQLESAGITGVCVQMKPQSIEDLTAIVALYRPGPMDSIPRFIQSKHRPETISYLTPQLEPILKVTYGCIVYQEQVIEIFRKLGGYTLGQSDNMRRAISKKKQHVIEQERRAFVYGDPERGIPGAVANGVDEQIAQKIYDDILDFANYAFNKAHAVCYAKVSYDTAYLKCHYPRQYMAALMTSMLGSPAQIASYIAECREMGIPLLPPDINNSMDVFAVEGEGIRFGLAGVKNVGRGLMKKLVAERERGGAFRSLEDFCTRMNETEMNKRAVENLIKCGAMDCFELKRSQMIQIYEAVMDTVAENNRRNVAGQLGLFSLLAEEDTAVSVAVPDIGEISLEDRMMLEKETTGLYLSGHPMDAYRAQLGKTHVAPIAAIVGEEARYGDEAHVTVAGIVQTVRLKTTRNNSMMAYVTLEDDTSAVELLVFANALSQYSSWLHENQAILVTGRVSIRDEKEPQIIVNSIQPLQAAQAPAAPQPAKADEPPAPTPNDRIRCSKLYLKLPSEDSLEYLKARAILNMFPGPVQTVLYFADTGLRRGTGSGPQRIMLEELTRLLGEGNVVPK